MAHLTLPTTASEAPRRFAVRPRVVGTLLWLRWRLILHRLGRSAGAVVGLILSLIIVLPLTFFGGLLLVVAFTNLPSAAAQATLYLVLTGIYLAWALLPLLQFSLNEGLDVTKLMLFPLTRLELMFSLVVSALLDVWTLFLLGILASVVIGWAGSLSTILAISGIMVLMYIHIIAFSQMLLAALMGLLRSRRFRDLSIILGTTLGLSCSLLAQVIAHTAVPIGLGNPLQGLGAVDYGSFLQYLPPGMAARAVQAVVAGNGLAAALWTLALFVALAPVLWAWSTILQRGLTRAEQGAARGAARRVVRRRAAAPVVARYTPASKSSDAVARRPILAAAMAMATKELRYYWRDPQYKRIFISSLYIVGILLLSLVGFRTSPTDGGGFNAPGAAFTTPYVILGVVALAQGLSSMIFGYEGSALLTLAIFPVRGIAIFLGKNLAAFIVALVEAILLVILQVVVAHAVAMAIPNFLVAVAAILVALGTGDVLAALFPVRIQRTGLGRPQQDNSSGCVQGMLRGLGYLISLMLYAPIALAVVIPTLTQNLQAEFVTLPLALLYGVGVYSGGLAIAAQLYYQRLPEILRIVAQD